MSKVKNVTSEAGVLTALDEMSNLITEYQKENFKFLSGESVASVQSGQIKPDEQGRFIKSAINWLELGLPILTQACFITNKLS